MKFPKDIHSVVAVNRRGETVNVGVGEIGSSEDSIIKKLLTKEGSSKEEISANQRPSVVNNILRTTVASKTKINGTPRYLPKINGSKDGLLDSIVYQSDDGLIGINNENPFYAVDLADGSFNVKVPSSNQGYRINGKLVVSYDASQKNIILGGSNTKLSLHAEGAAIAVIDNTGIEVTGKLEVSGVGTFDLAPSSSQDATTDNHLVRYSQLIADNITIDDNGLVVVVKTNLQDFADGVDHSLFKARGTGVNTTYVFVAAAGGTTFDMPEVLGEIKSDQGYFDVHYTGATGVTISDLSASSTYIYIDNANALQQQTSIPTRQDWSRKVFVARIGVNPSTNQIIGFEYLNNPLGNFTNTTRDVYDFLQAQGIPFKKNQIVTGRTDNLGFDVSAGELLEFGGTGDINNPNIKSFDAVANTSYNLMTRTTLASSETNLAKSWDNNGVITALGSTTLVGHRLYRFSSGNFAMQYGQGNYANISLAKAGIGSEDYVLNPVLKDATFMGWWLIEDIATNTGNTGATTTTAFVEYTIGIQGGVSSGLSGAVLRGNNGSDFLDIPQTRTNIGLATTENQTDSIDKRFMTDAQETKLDYLTVTQAVDLDQMDLKLNISSFTDVAVTSKLLTGLNISGTSVAATDSILVAVGKLQAQVTAQLGGLIFQSTWNAATNTPTITASTGTKGHYYIVSTAGGTYINGQADWKAKDWIVFNGATWDKVDNTDSVSSVNGAIGAISLTTDNIAEGVGKFYYTDAAVRIAISESITGIDYNNSTGVFSTTSGYSIPTTAKQGEWDTAWRLDGNTIGANKTIGSLDAYDVGIIRGGTEILTIKSTGLDVAGIVTATGDALLNGLTVGKGPGSGYNSAFGASALRVNTTGSGNLAIGYYSLYSSTTGSINTAIGYRALLFNTTGSNNTAIGGAAGLYLTTGSNNTILGYNSGATVRTGSGNTILGYNITGLSADLADTLIIGAAGRKDIYATATGVGIGVAEPSYKLDVNGTFHVSGAATFDVVPSSLEDATTDNHLVRYSQLTTNAWVVGATNIASEKLYLGTASGDFDLGIKRAGTEVLTVKSTGVDVTGKLTATSAAITGLTTNYLPKIGTEGLLVNSLVYENGVSVGIGTINPVVGAKLHVDKTSAGASVTQLLLHNNSGTDGTAANLDLVAFSSPTVITGRISNKRNAGGLYSLGLHNYIAGVGLAEVVSINYLRNVGINEVSPSYRLDVNGTGRFVGDLKLDAGLQLVTGAALGYVAISNASGGVIWTDPSDLNSWAGNFNASTNTPTLADGTGTYGDWYHVEVAGTVDFGAGDIVFALGDRVIYDGADWIKQTQNYTLNNASSSVLGGIKIGATLDIASGVANQKSGIATAGTYRSLTVDTYGRVTAGTNPTTIAGYGITNYDSLWDTRLAASIVPIANGGTGSSTKNFVDLTTAQASISGAKGFVSDITVNGLTAGRGAGDISSNSAFGDSALISNTTGNSTTAIGRRALYSNTTGANNAAIGSAALLFNTTGSNNTVIGVSAGLYFRTGSNNTAVGYGAGEGIETGSGNTILGYEINGLSATLANTLIIGAGGRKDLYGTATGIGIGVAEPAEKLDLLGNFKYSGLLKPSGTAGTDKQVLSTDGTNDAFVSLDGASYLSDWDDKYDAEDYGTDWTTNYDAITKNTGYNKNFGKIAGTVVEGSSILNSTGEFIRDDEDMSGLWLSDYSGTVGFVGKANSLAGGMVVYNAKSVKGLHLADDGIIYYNSKRLLDTDDLGNTGGGTGGTSQGIDNVLTVGNIAFDKTIEFKQDTTRDIFQFKKKVDNTLLGAITYVPGTSGVFDASNRVLLQNYESTLEVGLRADGKVQIGDYSTDTYKLINAGTYISESYYGAGTYHGAVSYSSTGYYLTTSGVQFRGTGDFIAEVNGDVVITSGDQANDPASTVKINSNTTGGTLGGVEIGRADGTNYISLNGRKWNFHQQTTPSTGDQFVFIYDEATSSFYANKITTPLGIG